MRMTVILPVLAMLAVQGVFCQAQPEATVAFTNVNLIPMTSEKVLPRQTVLIQGAHIFKIGDSKNFSIPRGATVIDGTGKYLIPGLADMHVHYGLREWETPDANLYLANGVTTVRDLTQGGTVGSIKRWCADFNSQIRLGPTIYNAWTLWGWEPHVAETVPLVKVNGYDCLKINSYFTRAEFCDLVARAKAAGLYTVGHVPWPLSMDEVIASGMNELSHVELLPIMLIDDPQFETLAKDKWDEEMLKRMFALLTPIHEDASGKALDKIKERLAGMIARMKGKGIGITTTLVCDEAIALTYNNLHEIVQRPGSMHLSPRFWGDLMKGKEKNAYFRGQEWAAQMFYDLIVFSLGEIRKNGIPIVAGTDSGPSFIAAAPGFALHDELRAIVACGYTPYEALAAATRDASQVVARMTGRDVFGTVEEGKRADLLLLAANPLKDIAAARTPLGVMTAGRWLPRFQLERLLQVKRRLGTPILREAWKKTNSVEAVIAQYRKLCSENAANEYYMSAGVLTSIGYDLLNLARIDDAITVFKFNIAEYPYDANNYDSLAEAYLKKGERSLAIENYRKALSLDPGFASSLKALQELEKDRR